MLTVVVLQSIREMVGDTLVYTVTIDGCDVACVQKYKRI